MTNKQTTVCDAGFVTLQRPDLTVDFSNRSLIVMVLIRRAGELIIGFFLV